MRAEILPTYVAPLRDLWLRTCVPLVYSLMIVIRRAMISEATCHNLTPGALNNMYPPFVDAQYRSWINDLLHVPGGHSDPVLLLVISAYECTVSILPFAGADCFSVVQFNAYELDLFLFKDMGLGGILSKFISRMSDQEIGGFEGFYLAEPIATWYQSFCDDYMAYLKVAERDAVLAAQIASPGTQVTFIEPLKKARQLFTNEENYK